MGASSGMSCCELIIPLGLPNLYLGVWGDDYTRKPLILFQKKKVQHQLIMNFQSNLLFVFLFAMPTKLTYDEKKDPKK